MSLQVLAQDMASRGRGPDTMLVHMAPQEVAGLQALARAHGGSLSVNPQTGLPEAGFLSSILPLIAGVALGPAGVGLTAMQAALATGAAGALATGSLKKGLMAGLGAYGGAGIGGILTDAGTLAASNLASAEAATAGELAAQQALTPSGIQAVAPAPVASSAPVAVAPAAPVVPAPTITPEGANTLMREFGVDASTLAPQTATPQPALPEYAASYENQFDLMPRAQPAPAAVEPVAVRTPGAPTYEQMRAAGFSDAEIAQSAREYGSELAGTERSPFSQAVREAAASPVKSGIKAISEKPDLLFNKKNLKYGLAAIAPMLLQEEKRAAYQGSGPNPYQYIYNPGRIANPIRMGGVGEYGYFAPSFTRMAEGGTVQNMSDRNAQETFLANGGQRFAEGGIADVPQYTYDPRTQRFTEITPVAPLAPVRTMTRMPGEYGGDISPSSMSVPTGNINSNSLTGGLVAALVGQQPAAQVVDLSTYGPGTFGGGNFGADNDDAAMGASIAAANQAAAAQAAQTSGASSGSGVEVGGPIGSGSATGADVGPLGGDFGSYAEGQVDSGPGDGAASSTSGEGSGSGDLARGGITALTGAFSRGGYNLGDYSDGGRLLRGPGDGVSDSIPATIADKRPARLADGEFVVPARIVSELGNGSTEAGARKLYAMMDRIQKNRAKTVGKGKVATNSRSDKLLPA